MKRNLTRSLLVAAGLAALACTQNKRGPKVIGEFHRYGTQMSQGGMVLPELPDAQLTNFPSAVKFDNANGFQVDGGAFEIRGHYRLERDSIFLDQESNGATRLAFAGRLFNDTLHLHWIPDYDVGSDSHEAEWQLFFVRSH
jgi:hypothetical protein